MTPAVANAILRPIPRWGHGANMVIDFQRNWGWMNGRFVPAGKIVDTHAGTHYADYRDGHYAAFPANVLSLTDRGAQTVPTRTNSIRNNSMVGAANPSTLPTNWATSTPISGLTETIVGTGTEHGLPYMDWRINGTANTGGGDYLDLNFESSVQIVASSGQVWTISFGHKLVGGSFGSLTLLGQINENTSAGDYVVGGNGTFTTPDATFRREAHTRTLAGGGTVARIRPILGIGNITNSLAIDFTLRIYAPQVELGAFASPPILTTSAAVAIAGNQQVISGLTSQLANGVYGFVQLDSRAPVAETSFVQVLSINDGTGNNSIIVQRNGSGGVRLNVIVATASTVTSAIAWASGLQTFAFAAGDGFADIQQVGGSGITAITPSYPVVSQVNIGGAGLSAGANAFQSTRKLALWFGAPNATLFNEVFGLASIAHAA